MIGLGICAAGLLLAAAGFRRPALRTSGLTLVLAGFFATFTEGLTRTQGISTSHACALLFGAIAVFRLMSGFEKGR